MQEGSTSSFALVFLSPVAQKPFHWQEEKKKAEIKHNWRSTLLKGQDSAGLHSSAGQHSLFQG